VFNMMSLHTAAEIAKYATVWAALFALGPALVLLIAALAFLMLPCAIIGLPFLLWAFFGPERREVVQVVEERHAHARLAHAHG
jgi:hypothetical protein